MSNLYEINQGFQKQLLMMERESAGKLLREYARRWKGIQARVEELAAQYYAVSAAGEVPPISWVYEFERLQALQVQVEGEISKFAEFAGESIKAEQWEAIAAAQNNANTLMRASFPEGVSISYNRLPKGAFQHLVGFLQDGSPLSGLLNELPGEAGKLVADGLKIGLLLGWNPKKTAESIRNALGGNLARALRIARTETLRSYREATRQIYQANSHVLKGWKWSSARNERTCAMCWMMDGTIHGLEERMEEHICGRCAMIPVTKPWRELGFNVDEIESGQPGTGIEAFQSLSHTEQMKILGPAKYAAWKDSKFSLVDIVGRKNDPDWGWTLYEKSLKELIGVEEAKKYNRLALMGVAGNAGHYSVDDLIRISGLGLHELTSGEMERVVQHVANAGFSSTEKMQVRTPIRGQYWNGKRLEIGDMIPTEVGHYLKHVIVSQEWPEGTTLEDYKQSLQEVILDPDSDIFVSKYNDAWQIGFVHENQRWRGVRGKDFILVEYKVKYGYWTTGFQPQNLKRQVFEGRENIVWLRSRILK